MNKLPTSLPAGATEITAADLSAQEKLRKAQPSQSDMASAFPELNNADGTFGGSVDLTDRRRRGVFRELVKNQMDAQIERSEQIATRVPIEVLRAADGRVFRVPANRIAGTRGLRPAPMKYVWDEKTIYRADGTSIVLRRDPLTGEITEERRGRDAGR